MFWLPIAFVCSVSLDCQFFSGSLSISIQQCSAQNEIVKIALEKNDNIKAYQTDCIPIDPKVNDSL